jgi:hypothetical protein
MATRKRQQAKSGRQQRKQSGAATERKSERGAHAGQPQGRGPREHRELERMPEQTEPAQEWGERLDTGRTIERGGKTAGPVPSSRNWSH